MACHASVSRAYDQLTDHYMFLGIRKVSNNFQAKRNQINEFRSMRNCVREAFLFDLQGVDWEMATSTAFDDPNIMANNFCDFFHSILDVHAQLTTRKGIMMHTPSPWSSPSIKNLKHKRDRAKKRAEKDHLIWPEYKRLRNRVTRGL